MIVHNKHAEPWKVTVVDTGLNTQTGGRVKRVRDYIGNEPFMLTYGDAVGDVNITELVNFHKAHGKIGTMSMYNFGQNKGVVEVGANAVLCRAELSNWDFAVLGTGILRNTLAVVGTVDILSDYPFYGCFSAFNNR